MKNIYIVLLLLLGYTISLSGQGALDVSAQNIECPEISTGSFTLVLASSVLEQYDLPFSAEWENLDNGDYEEFQFNYSFYLLEGLEAGNYEIIINLGENCTIEYTGEITSTTNIDLELKGENPTLSSDCSDGFIDLRIDGGVAPYDIVWERLESIVPFITEVVKVSNGVSGDDGQEDLENARDGSYRVMVTDAMCDPVYANTILNCECGEDCEVVGQIMNAYCGELGAIRVELNCGGSTAPIKSYKWGDGSDAASLENLMPGDYCVTITDENDCENDQCFTVESGEEDVTVSLLEIKHVTLCNEDEECGDVGCDNDGRLTISINSNESYMLTWTGPNGFSSNQEMLSNLERGIYSLEVNFENPSNCDILETYTIAVCDRTVYNSHWEECENFSDYGEYEAIVTLDEVTPVSDDNLCGGALDIDINAPYNSFFFHWEGPDGFSSIDEDIDGLCEGEYCLILDNGCSTQEDCFDIVNCDNVEIRVDGLVTNTCPNVDFGSIDEVLVEGGEEPYDYQWSSGQTTQNLDRLFEGVYTLTVTDRNGCEAVGEFRVTDENNVVPNRPPDECNIYYSCNGMPAYQANVEVAGCEYLEEDCRYERCICEDGYELEDRFVGLSDYYERSPNNPCEVIRFCRNGEPFDIVYGTFTQREYKVLDITNVTAQTVWYCCYYEGCIFEAYPQYTITTKVEDNLQIAIVEIPPNGCKYEAYCSDPTTPFYEYQDDEECIEPQRGNCNDFDIDDFTVFSPDNSTIVRGKKYYQIESSNGDVIWESEGHRIKMSGIAKKQDLLVVNKVSPNPFSDEFVVQINSSSIQNVKFSIVTHTGQSIYSGNTDLLVGENNKVIDLSSVKYKGLMILSVIDENNSIFRSKLIKL